MDDLIGLIVLLIAVGIAAGGIGYCVKQNNEEAKIKDPVLICVERRWATVAECKELYRK